VRRFRAGGLSRFVILAFAINCGLSKTPIQRAEVRLHGPTLFPVGAGELLAKPNAVMVAGDAYLATQIRLKVEARGPAGRKNRLRESEENREAQTYTLQASHDVPNTTFLLRTFAFKRP
jgi:hypothetical protein